MTRKTQSHNHSSNKPASSTCPLQPLYLSTVQLGGELVIEWPRRKCFGRASKLSSLIVSLSATSGATTARALNNNCNLSAFISRIKVIIIIRGDREYKFRMRIKVLVSFLNWIRFILYQWMATSRMVKLVLLRFLQSRFSFEHLLLNFTFCSNLPVVRSQQAPL